jgi:hypothetical protein
MESSLIVLQHCKARQPTQKPACGDTPMSRVGPN